MKKIFAIALALVMVLSMASAFAANDCSTFSWTCPTTATNCGKGKIEVVPYVMVNDACGDFTFEVSTCASAINSQYVYYAVKLTVEANPDMKWWDKAEYKVTAKGMESTEGDADLWEDYTVTNLEVAAAGDDEFKNSSEQVWYQTEVNGTTGEWINAADEDFDVKNVVFPAKVENAVKAKVCATLTSEDDGVDANGNGEWKIGDYKVTIAATGTDFKAGKITIEKGTSCVSKFEMSWVDGKVKTVYADSPEYLAEVTAKFNLNGCVAGTCVDKDILKANFGWKDKVESCFSWSDKGASVVNPECVVTLPKTGDASLLWWLF